MHHIMGVGVAQRIGHFARDGDGLLQGELALAIQPVAQGLPLHVRHGVKEQARTCAVLRRDLTRIEQAEDVGMLQGGAGGDLAQKALTAQSSPEFGPQHLQRDSALMLEVLREVHSRHPAAAELALDPVTIA